jgi:TonB family protein
VLTDFGIAKAASGQRLTGTGMSIGTPHYMSPEQARAQTTDGRSDLYSLGVVAYQCLTGRVPYDGDDSFSIGYKHITEPVPTPSLASVDERRLFEVIRRMLAKEPADRFQDCDELVTALQADPVAPPGPLRHRGAAQAAMADTVAAPKLELPSTAPPPPSLERTTPVRATPARTTPVPATPSAGSTAGAPAQRYAPRRVAHRSAAMKAQDRPLWPWVLVLLALAGGATAWSHFGNALAASPESPDSNPAPSTSDRSADSVPALATTPPASASAVDSASLPPRSAARASSVATSAPAPVTRGMGGLRIRGIPRGSIVQVDQEVPRSAVSVLAAGRHEVAISAPLHHFFIDTVLIRPDDTLDFEPRLVPTSAGGSDRAAGPAAAGPSARRTADTGPCEPGASYDASQCFDARPRPAVAPFIPVPAGAAVPEQGTLVWVQVSTDGRTTSVRSRRSSGSREFDQAAVAFVQQLGWSPATRVGVPVAAWVPLEVRPAPQ